MNVLKTKSDTSHGQPGDWTVETQPWLRRRRESRVGEWMLAFPQKEVRRVVATDETGRPCSIQIVKAPRCAKRHLPGMVEAADRLATQALKEAAAANSVQEEDVWDELVPYVSETARVVGGSDTNREAVSGWGKATENAVPVRSCKERDTP